MTNPISKAIVKAAVAMGYGKKSDYKGSSVADVLEKFASIAKDKGGSGGGAFIVTASEDENHVITVDKALAEIVAAHDENKVVIARLLMADSNLVVDVPLVFAASEVAMFASISYYGGSTATLVSLTIPVTGSAYAERKTVELR